MCPAVDGDWPATIYLSIYLYIYIHTYSGYNGDIRGYNHMAMWCEFAQKSEMPKNSHHSRKKMIMSHHFCGHPIFKQSHVGKRSEQGRSRKATNCMDTLGPGILVQATYMKFRTPLVNIHKTWQWTIQHFSWNIIYSTNRDMPVCIMRVNKWCGWAGTPNIMPKTTNHPCSLHMISESETITDCNDTFRGRSW